jgi:hypothetical protein
MTLTPGDQVEEVDVVRNSYSRHHYQAKQKERPRKRKVEIRNNEAEPLRCVYASDFVVKSWSTDLRRL